MKGYTMKENKYSDYATNKGGKITAPKNPAKSDPKVQRTVGNDLRTKKG
jgi:hypothetical protein